MSDQAPSSTPAPPIRRRRSFVGHMLKWTGIGIGTLALLLFVGLYVPGVRQWAFEQGRSILAEAGVRSEGIDGDWTRMTLTNVALDDDQGTWATASEIVLSWSPWGLLSFTVHATHVEFRGMHVLRQPAYKPAPEQADEPFAWPDLPVDIKLERLTGDLTLDAAVIGQALTASMDGNAALTAAGGNAALALKRTDGVPGEASVSARSDSDLDNIEIAFNVKDARLAAELTGDARLENLEVALQATRNGGACSGQAAISARDGPLASLGVSPDCIFAVHLPEVARLLSADAVLAGPANLSVQLKEDGTDTTTHFQLAADLSKLASSNEAVARLLPGASAGALVMFTADGVRLDNFQGQLANGKVAVTGSALVGARRQAKAELNASDLSVLRPDLQGQLQASFGYDDAAAIPIAFTARGTNVVSGRLSWSAVDASGAIDAGGSGNMTLTAAGKAPIDVAVTVANAFGGAMQVTAKGTVAEARIDASAAQSANGYSIDATLETQRLEHLGAIAGMDVAGGVRAHVSGVVGGSANALTLDATMSNARFGRTEIGDARLTARGPLSALEITLNGRAPMPPRVVDYSLAATVTDFVSARVSVLDIRSATERLTTTQPFTVHFGNALLVEGFAATVARSGRVAGQIAANAELTAGGAVVADARVTAVDMEALTALLGQPSIGGVLNATATLDGGAGTARLSGSIEGLRTGNDQVPPANLAIDGSWSSGRVSLAVTVRAQGLPDATARVAFPMARAQNGGFPSPAPNAPLDGTVDWSGRLAPLWRLADIGAADLDGDARIQGRIGGTLGNPQFSGSATLANGSFVDDRTGIRLVRLNLAASIAGGRLTVTGTGSDGAQGQLEINATTTLGGGISDASGGLRLTNVRLLARDDLVARLDGALNLAATGGRPLLSGQLTVSNLQAAIPEATPSDLITVDVFDPERGKVISGNDGRIRTLATRAADGAASPEAQSPAGSLQTMALDVTIAIPGPARVTGRGLDSVWRGNLSVTGDLTDPLIGGRLILMRGTWTFGARVLTLTEGTITFDGGPNIQPLLDITATQQDNDFVASLHLTGRSTSPTITATSVPAAPQDEVFARILFGRSVTNLTALEGLQLANSIAQISGLTGSGPGVLGSLRDRFGLDLLTVDYSDKGASVRAGRYLTERVYFELKQSGDSEGTRGRLELQLNDKVSVETEVGSNSSSSIGLRYRFDY